MSIEVSVYVSLFEYQNNKDLSDSFKNCNYLISSVQSNTLSLIKCLAIFSSNKQSLTILYNNKSKICSAYSAIPDNMTQVIARNDSDNMVYTRRGAFNNT